MKLNFKDPGHFISGLSNELSFVSCFQLESGSIGKIKSNTFSRKEGSETRRISFMSL